MNTDYMEVDNVLDEVSEEEFNRLNEERRQKGNFVVNDEGGHDDLGYYDDGRDLLADMHESNQNQYSPSKRIYSKHLEKKGKKIQNELDQQKQIQIDNIFRTSGSVPTYMSSTPNIPKSNVSSEEFDRIFEGMLNKQPSPQKRVLSPKKERKRPLKEEKPVVEPVKPEPKVVPKQEEEEQEFEFPDEIELPSTITAVEEKKNDEEMEKPSPLKVEPKITTPPLPLKQQEKVLPVKKEIETKLSLNENLSLLDEDEQKSIFSIPMIISSFILK